MGDDLGMWVCRLDYHAGNKGKIYPKKLVDNTPFFIEVNFHRQVGDYWLNATCPNNIIICMSIHIAL